MQVSKPQNDTGRVPKRELLVVRDPDALATAAADFVIQTAARAVSERGRFTWVLSGGTTPQRLYARLAQPEHARAINWPRTSVFFGDERFVPHDDPRSNFRLAHETLLAHVPLPAEQIFAIPTNGSTPAHGAEAYARTLGEFFSIALDQAPPRFDLVLLGLGDDGHTASLFPHAAALEVSDRWVTWSPPGTLPPPVDRVTLTYPALNAARHVAFLVEGERKADALRAVLEARASRVERPAAGVLPTDGILTWLVDEQAARRLQTQR